jgi:glutathione S-transferase
VPSLVTDRGILTETPAILAFIAQSFPEARLAPLDDPFAFAQLQAFNSYLCSTVHVAHAHGGRGYRGADEEASFADMKRKVPQTMSECMTQIETHMLEEPWVFGPSYTVCDPYLFTVSRWLARDGVDIAEFPKIRAHAAKMDSRPSVRNVLRRELE